MRTILCAALLAVTAVIASADSPADSLRWYSHSTEHFTFIYRTAHQPAIDELSSFADEVYAEITGFFGSDPGHVPVVVYGETDLANGYYSPAPPQHIGLFVAQPSLPWVGASTGSWLRLLLVHELTHYVHANYDRGLFRLLGTVFGRSLGGLFIGFAPIWTTEGLAVNTETIYTSGGRGRDPFFEMLYKAPVVENRLHNLRQAGYDSHLAPPGRYYVAGYFIWDYLLKEYGPEIVGEIFDDFARFPLFGIWGAIRRTTGDPMRHIYPRIVAHLESRYAGLRAINPAPRITPLTRADYHLPVQTDRGLYLYRRRPDARPAVVRFDRATGVEEPVLEMRLTDEASWSVTADGMTIAFAAITADNTYPDEPAISSNLYLRDLATGRTTQLSRDGGYYQPAIAPDGTYLVAVRREGSYHRLVRFDLPASVSDAEGPEPRILLDPDDARLYTPEVSPDGSRIALVVNQRGDQQVVLVGANDGAVTVLDQPEGGLPYHPTFASNEVLLYGHDRGGTLALYRHDLATHEIAVAAHDPIGAFAGRVVDGELIFSTYTSDGYALRAGPWTEVGPAKDPVPVSAARPIASFPAPEPMDRERYYPLPRPVFWLPTLGIAGPGLEASGLGGGALVYGADYLGRNAWQATAVWFPALSQIDYALAWQTRYGPFAFQAETDALYRVSLVAPDEPVYLRSIRQGLAVSYLLRLQHKLGVSRQSSVALSATHLLGFLSRTPFAVGQATSNEVELRVNRIALGTTYSASATPLSSIRAFHAPWARSIAVAAATPLDAPEFTPQALVTFARARLNVGLGGTDHVLALVPQTSYATSSRFASPFGLRGFEATTDHTASAGMRGRYRLALDYHTPHLLVDIPLLPSVGITGFGLTLFSEATGGYDPSPARAVVDPAVVVGAELTTVVTYWANIPVRLGLAARIRPQDLASFSVPEDVSLYLRSDFLQSIPRIPRYLDQ